MMQVIPPDTYHTECSAWTPLSLSSERHNIILL